MDAEGAAGVCFDYRLETLGGSEVGECGWGWGGGGVCGWGGGPLGGEAGAGKGERDTEVAKKVGIHWIEEINEIRNIVKTKVGGKC